jgi:hydroxyacylglutathione hydrolase
MQIKQFVFNGFAENTYILFDESKKAVVIDPGCYGKDEESQLKLFVEENSLEVIKLLNTHCHIDHVLGNYFVKQTYNVPLIIHEIEVPYLESVSSYSTNYGFAQYSPTVADQFIKEGDSINFGDQELKILFTPGHSAGHVVFYHEQSKSLIGGDVLFRQSIGRTDLPGGNHQQLLDSIRDKLWPLPEDVTVFPGHGPQTTIGFEKKHNPFF